MSRIRASRTGLLQRGIALLACLSLLYASAEVTIPDVHDGDGAAAMTSPTGSGDQLAAAPANLPVDPAGPLHSHHVDHCTHTHADGVPAVLPVFLGVTDRSGLPVVPEKATSSLSAAPHHPPPIA